MDKIKLIQRRYRRRSFLTSHAFLYLAVVVGIWLNWIPFAEVAFANGQLNTLMDRIIVTVVWGLILMMHVAQVWFKAAEERAIVRVLESEAGKAKRGVTYEDEREDDAINETYDSRRVRLSDDGELIASYPPQDPEPDTYHSQR